MISKQHIILGIDPGYDRLGWAVVRHEGSKTVIVISGCIRTSSQDKTYKRYEHILVELQQILKQFKPQECGIENLFFEKNAKTAMRVSEARGLIIGSLLQHHVEVFDYTPLQIKAAVAGNGRASKQDVRHMLQLLTGHEKLPKLDDEVDAIATAFCHAVSRSIRRII
ncbi:MAG TPA: crossover junction endodeoxyribonuclease RuvC [Patescibacteria group bacterium]|nr:crossover junction endodeoxyribonuclease RuvC [Patescibacteria group bacterium]